VSLVFHHIPAVAKPMFANSAPIRHQKIRFWDAKKITAS